MIEMMKQYAESGEFVALYTDLGNTSSFIYGRILAVDDTWVAILPVTQDGVSDGLLVKLCEDVFRMDAGGEYAKKMQRLMGSNPKLEDYSIDAERIAESVLQLAKTEHEIVAVEIENSGIDDITGFVKDSNDKTVIFDVVDSYGAPDGIAMIKASGISQIEYNGIAEKRIQRLAVQNEAMLK